MMPQPLSEAEILARVLYRDGAMLILDKPAGLAVHVTGHDKVALDQSFHHLQFGLPRKPELAHRLDRGTSGCLVLGRHRQALIKLGKLFASGVAHKRYLAVLHGVPAEQAGVIDAPILKSGAGSRWKLSLDPKGQPALTEYELLAQLPPGAGEVAARSLVAFMPRTGRTHQIRLHAAFALGCPVVGDPFYGPPTAPGAAMLLHAQRITLPYYRNKPDVMAEAPLPEFWPALPAIA